MADTSHAVAMSRYALQPFTFSNGIHVPKGTFIACAQYDTHHDEENYADPDTFDPWYEVFTESVQTSL